MKKQNFVCLVSSLLLMGLLSCEQNNNSVLLQGRIVDSTAVDGLVTYSPDGNIFNSQMTSLEFDENGNFLYTTDLEGESGDVTIEIDGIGYFGAHLVKGKTLKMSIVKDGGKWNALFEGENADVNRFVNEFTQRFDQMIYWSPDPSESKSNVEYRQLLAENYEKVKSALDYINNTNTVGDMASARQKEKQVQDDRCDCSVNVFKGRYHRCIQMLCAQKPKKHRYNIKYGYRNQI